MNYKYYYDSQRSLLASSPIGILLFLVYSKNPIIRSVSVGIISIDVLCPFLKTLALYGIYAVRYFCYHCHTSLSWE